MGAEDTVEPGFTMAGDEAPRPFDEARGELEAAGGALDEAVAARGEEPWPRPPLASALDGV